MPSESPLERVPDLDAQRLPIEWRDDGSIAYEVPHEQPAQVDIALSPELIFALEIPPYPVIEILDGEEFRQFDAEIVLAQPAVIAKDWRRGWCPIGGRFGGEIYLGDQPEINLEVGRTVGHSVGIVSNQNGITLEKAGTFRMHVVVRKNNG